MYFPRVKPEEVGIPSEAIIAFLDRIEKEQLEIHSFMMLREGKVFLEGYYYPYNDENKNYMYSVSKSITCTAVGLANHEGLLNIDDKVLDYIDVNDLPDKIDKRFLKLTIRHLLTMSAGLNHEPNILLSDNWRKLYFESKFVADPGEVFYYNSVNSYILSTIVCKASKQSLVDYLMPRLFEPLHIDRPTWQTCPDGYEIGGWGLSLKTEDLAKISQLYLQNGIFEGKQVIPQDWVAMIEKKQVESNYYSDGIDYNSGYSFQFWQCRDGNYRMDGVFGQFGIILKDKNMVIVMTAGRFDSQTILNIFWDTIIKSATKKLPNNPSLNEQLEKKLKALHADHVFDKEEFDGQFMYESITAHFVNPVVSILPLAVVGFFGAPLFKAKKYSFDFHQDKWILKWYMSKKTYTIEIGLHGQYIENKMDIDHQVFSVYAGGFIESENEIELRLRVIDTPHTKILKFKFEQIFAYTEADELPHIEELSEFFATSPVLTPSKIFNDVLVGGGLKLFDIPSIAKITKSKKC